MRRRGKKFSIVGISMRVTRVKFRYRKVKITQWVRMSDRLLIENILTVIYMYMVCAVVQNIAMYRGMEEVPRIKVFCLSRFRFQKQHL